VAIVAIGLSNIEWPAKAAFTSPTLALPASAGDGGNEETTQDVLPKLNGQNGGALASSSAIARLAQPHTIIPERPRLDIITYAVQAGDTVQSIADLFGLQPTSIMWANPAIEDAPDLLRIGQEVTILPIDGAYHKVAEGDTLESIAEEYKVEPEAIVACEYNPLEAPVRSIQEGTWLIVPGGEKPYVPKVVTTYTGSVPEGARGTGRFQWPVLGRITQGYWYGHRAIDIGAPIGGAVVAADGGFISFAGWTDVGYGYLIVIDHANGFATYYAHLSNIYVFTGQAVERGQVIAASGNTGWSTGPHLHFEVRYYGAQQNPRAYLP
jgi:murein DD-endopeptidase MepM/ murein hydrolase activator NlpD